MWTQTHSTRISDIDAALVWSVWTDVNRWSEWQPDLEHTRLDGPFEAGTRFLLRPRGGPNVNVQLLEVRPGEGFTDLTKFPLAEMLGEHELVRHGNELEIRTTISVRGALSFLWIRLVASEVVAGLPEQTRLLVNRARYLGACRSSGRGTLPSMITAAA